MIYDSEQERINIYESDFGPSELETETTNNTDTEKITRRKS